MEAKNKTLNLTDIAVLALLFFGSAMAASVMSFFELGQAGLSGPEDLSVNDLATYQTLVLEAVLLFAAWLYLRWRRFDFGVLDFRVNRYTLPLAVLLAVAAGLAADVYQYVHAAVLPEHYPQTEHTPVPTLYTPELVLTSLMNGFFEELFFMGLVFAVAPRKLPKAVAFSLVVRFLFHTYQGLAGALTITMLGIVFFLFRRKIPVLVPFFLAHGFFDIFGLTFLWLPFWQ